MGEALSLSSGRLLDDDDDIDDTFSGICCVYWRISEVSFLKDSSFLKFTSSVPPNSSNDLSTGQFT